MKKKLESHFKEVKEVLEVLPTKSKSNRQKKKEYIIGENNIVSDNIKIVLASLLFITI